MNRNTLNGALLGAGVSNNRTFLVSAVHAVAMSVARVVAHMGLWSEVEARASGTSEANAMVRMAAAVVARAVGVSSFYGAGVKHFVASVVARAVGALGTEARLSFVSHAEAKAGTTSTLLGTAGSFLSSAVTGSARGISRVAAWIKVTSTVVATARANALVSVGAWIASAVIAEALSRSVLVEAASAAPDRLMVLPTDARNMEIPE